MFGFGGKTAEDVVWISTARSHSSRIAEIAEMLDIASQAIASDLIYGWLDARTILEELPALKKDCKEMQRSFKSIGKPAKESEWRPVDDLFSQFMDAISLAARWGKFHLNDQSGDPGNRAVTETGFALRAAQKRVKNNGAKFAENANMASMFATYFLSAVRTEHV